MSDVTGKDTTALVYIPALESLAERLERLIDDIPGVLPEAMGDDAFRHEIHQVLIWVRAGTQDICRRLSATRESYTDAGHGPAGPGVREIWERRAPSRPGVFAALAERLPDEDPYETAHLGEMLHQLGRFMASYARAIGQELPQLADLWTDNGCTTCLRAIRRFIKKVDSAAVEIDSLGLRCLAIAREPYRAASARQRAA